MACVLRRTGFVILALLIGLSLLPQVSRSQEKPQSRVLVLKGATVIDGLGHQPIPNAVIVIEGDKVKSFGGADTSYPADANVVDLSGKYIIPGLVDCHVHYQPWLGELFLNYGVTSICEPGGNNDHGEREASYRSDERSPRIFASQGRPAFRPNMNHEQVVQAMQEWLKKKPDFANFDVYNERNKQQWQWAAEVAHEAGLMVFGHTENAPASIEAGEDVVEHLWGFAEALMTPEELQGFRQGKYLHWGLFLKESPRRDQLIADAVRRGVILNPTLVYELGSQSPVAHKHELELYNLFADPNLMTYFPEDRAVGSLYKFRSVRNFSTRYESPVAFPNLSSEDFRQFQEAYRLVGEFVKKWVQDGGKIFGGTDDPSSGMGGITLHIEMEMLTEPPIGLTPMQALETEESWGAALLAGRNKTSTQPPVGIIAPGAFADIVVLGADPLADITNTNKIERVIKGGEFIKLGYTPYYTEPRPQSSTIPHNPEPEISAITPHAVVEGGPDVDITVEGVGFTGNSQIRIDGVPVPTTFVDIRTLKAKVPAAVVARALPNRFIQPGPEQLTGVYGDRTVKITVFNAPPDGGLSGSVSIRVTSKDAKGGG